MKELLDIVFSCEENISMLTLYLFTVIIESDTLLKERYKKRWLFLNRLQSKENSTFRTCQEITLYRRNKMFCPYAQQRFLKAVTSKPFRFLNMFSFPEHGKHGKRGIAQVSSGLPSAASTCLHEKMLSQQLAITLKLKLMKDSLGYDTSKSDHKTVARKHRASNCREGNLRAAVQALCWTSTPHIWLHCPFTVGNKEPVVGLEIV